MVNVGLNPGAMLGIVLFVAGAGLYFLRSVRPELARDQDIFFMAVAVLCGGILFFQGWRLDPILTFGQFLLTGSAIFFAVESIRLRGLATAQAKRNTPIVDDERPISQVYRAELDLDELEPDEEPSRPRPMIGTRDTSYDRADEYADEMPRRPPRRSSSTSRTSSSMSGRTKRRPRPPETRQTRQPRDWDASDYGTYSSDDQTYSTQRRNGDQSWENRPPVSTSKPRRSRPSRKEESVQSGNYVDYQPVDPLEDEGDNLGNFDY